MRVVEIAQIENAFVIHFDTDDKRINAYTFASTIIALADAAKAANASLNPGSQIEVVVEALGPGSFRAQIRALYSRAKSLFESPRFLRRLNTLRGLSHDEVKQVFT